MSKLRVFVVGLGNMGLSHAQAYHSNPGFEIVGLANRSEVTLPAALQSYPRFGTFEEGLAKTKPDLVSINTLTDSHADYAITAMEAGAHVFIEKPLAATVEDAERVVATAKRLKRKLVIGYILRHHPSLDGVHPHRARTGRPVRHAHEPQPAIPCRAMGDAQAADAIDLADRRLRRPLCRRDVPDLRRQAQAGARHGRAPLRRDRAGHVQLRPPAGDVRGRLGRLVRGGLGPDDLRDRLLREGRDDAQGLRLHRHEGRRQVGRHGDPHQDLDHPHALGGTGPRRPLCPARPRYLDGATSRATRRCATASRPMC